MLLSRLALPVIFVACANPPGDVTIVNEYSGSCQITVSIGDDADSVPVAAGESAHEVDAGLVPITFRTSGVVCSAVPCTFVGSMTTGLSGCGIYAADGLASERIVIGEGPANCPNGDPEVLPTITCGSASP